MSGLPPISEMIPAGIHGDDKKRLYRVPGSKLLVREFPSPDAAESLKWLAMLRELSTKYKIPTVLLGAVHGYGRSRGQAIYLAVNRNNGLGLENAIRTGLVPAGQVDDHLARKANYLADKIRNGEEYLLDIFSLVQYAFTPEDASIHLLDVDPHTADPGDVELCLLALVNLWRSFDTAESVFPGHELRGARAGLLAATYATPRSDAPVDEGMRELWRTLEARCQALAAKDRSSAPPRVSPPTGGRFSVPR